MCEGVVKTHHRSSAKHLNEPYSLSTGLGRLSKLYAPSALLNYRATLPSYWSIIFEFLNRDANERQGVIVAFCEECRQATFRAPPYPRNCSYRQDRDSCRQDKLDNRIEKINVVVFEY